MKVSEFFTEYGVKLSCSCCPWHDDSWVNEYGIVMDTGNYRICPECGNGLIGIVGRYKVRKTTRFIIGDTFEILEFCRKEKPCNAE